MLHGYGVRRRGSVSVFRRNGKGGKSKGLSRTFFNFSTPHLLLGFIDTKKSVMEARKQGATKILQHFSTLHCYIEPITDVTRGTMPPGVHCYRKHRCPKNPLQIFEIGGWSKKRSCSCASGACYSWFPCPVWGDMGQRGIKCRLWGTELATGLPRDCVLCYNRIGSLKTGV